LLGSTGSIGVQSLQVAEEENIDVIALACGRNVQLLSSQIRIWHPRYVSVQDESSRQSLLLLLGEEARYHAMPEDKVPLISNIPDTVKIQKNEDSSPSLLVPSSSDLPVIGVGRRGAVLAASLQDADTVIGAITGFAGLEPVLAAADCGKKIALANKESLVAAGEVVRRRAARGGAWILPVDSEHSAVWQCALAASEEALSRVMLTCSGGPFLGFSKGGLAAVTPDQALRHPTWSMGNKITVDSATLMNKGFELIEACRLFHLPPERVEVVVHPECIVHSLAVFSDGSVLAQLGLPDMKMPIRFALTFPDRSLRPESEQFDLLHATSGALTFLAPDEDVFPSILMARDAVQQGGLMPLVLNAANEAAVSLFLAGNIDFPKLFSLIAGALHDFNHMSSINESSFDAMMAVHQEVREDVIRQAEITAV
jgi:1-deoxy-D-xylulose-5-phosphate reductoisomerase